MRRVALRNLPKAAQFRMRVVATNAVGDGPAAPSGETITIHTRVRPETPVEDCKVDHWECFGEEDDAENSLSEEICALGSAPLPACQMKPRREWSLFGTGSLKCEGKKYSQ